MVLLYTFGRPNKCKFSRLSFVRESKRNKRAVPEKGGFGKCALIPGFGTGNIRMYPHPGFWYRGTSECTLVPYFLECRKWGFKRWGFKQIRGYLRKKAFFLCFLDFPGALRTLRKRAKKAEKDENGRFRPISRKGGQTPLKPPFVTPPFAAAQGFGTGEHPAEPPFWKPAFANLRTNAGVSLAKIGG